MGRAGGEPYEAVARLGQSLLGLRRDALTLPINPERAAVVSMTVWLARL